MDLSHLLSTTRPKRLSCSQRPGGNRRNPGPGRRPIRAANLRRPGFFVPSACFHPSRGRPSVPRETSLRMVTIQYRDHLRIEQWCDEISGSVSRFCRDPWT